MTAYDTAILDAHIGLPSQPAQTIAGYWPLDAAPGATTLREASGGPIGPFPFSAARGTAGNASILPGDTGTCIHKTDTGDMQIAWSTIVSNGAQSSVQQPGPITVIAWVQLDTISVTDTSLRQFIFGQANSYDLHTARYGAVSELTGPASGNAATALGIIPGNPTMLAMVYDRANNKLYENGVLLATTPATAALTTQTTNLELGGLFGVAGVKGYIQKVAFYGSALSQAQLQNLYVIGAATAAETAGRNLNVYPFSRQALAAGPGTIVNPSDTPMYVMLGDTSHPAAPQQGDRINPNGGRWSTPAGYTGPVQICHSNWLGAKVALISTST